MALAFIASFLIVSVVAQASGHDLETQSSPAFLIIGKSNGDIKRCPVEHPEDCDTFQKGKEIVVCTVVHGEYLYAALQSAGVPSTRLQSMGIVRCEWDRKQSCAVYHETVNYIITMTVSDGYLYAGGSGDFKTGVVLLCELNRPNSCFIVQKFLSVVVDMFELNKNMYIATKESLLCCSKGADLRCSNVQFEEDLGRLISVSHLGNTIITLNEDNKHVMYYNLTSSDSMNRIKGKQLHTAVAPDSSSVKVFKRNVYVLLDMGRVELSEDYNNFKELKSSERGGESFPAISMSFAYATHRIHNQHGVCKSIELGSSGVYNYNVEHRNMLEVTVVDGRLRDARGAVVDTRRADRGYSGPAAVFAMGPDGQLLLSNAHRSGLVDITSLFASNPVSGAGEIVVEDGVVKRIIACSMSYWPDINLNKQVVDELYKKGYDKADEIKLETCDYKCGIY